MFEKIYCINLDDRTDRWEECKDEFKRVGLTVERFSGISNDFNLSQYRCLKKASKHKSSLILEDDVEFVNGLETLSQLKEWDVIFLGATLNSPHKEKIYPNWYRYTDGWATQAVGYKKEMIEWILENFDPKGGVIYDEWLRLNVLTKFRCYIASPMICYQRPSFSDLRNRFVDYTNGFKQSEGLFQ